MLLRDLSSCLFWLMASLRAVGMLKSLLILTGTKCIELWLYVGGEVSF